LPLIAAAGGYYFWLDPKVAKDQVSPKASLRSGPLRCKTGRTWAGIFLPFASPHLACTSVKISFALQPHRADIVLPVFG
jgi:hypothetical protein